MREAPGQQNQSEETYRQHMAFMSDIAEFERRALLPVNSGLTQLDLDAISHQRLSALFHSLTEQEPYSADDDKVHRAARNGERVLVEVKPVISMLGVLRRMRAEAELE